MARATGGSAMPASPDHVEDERCHCRAHSITNPAAPDEAMIRTVKLWADGRTFEPSNDAIPDPIVGAIHPGGGA